MMAQELFGLRLEVVTEQFSFRFQMYFVGKYLVFAWVVLQFMQLKKVHYIWFALFLSINLWKVLCWNKVHMVFYTSVGKTVVLGCAFKTCQEHIGWNDKKILQALGKCGDCYTKWPLCSVHQERTSTWLWNIVYGFSDAVPVAFTFLLDKIASSVLFLVVLTIHIWLLDVVLF